MAEAFIVRRENSCGRFATGITEDLLDHTLSVTGVGFKAKEIQLFWYKGTQNNQNLYALVWTESRGVIHSRYGGAFAQEYEFVITSDGFVITESNEGSQMMPFRGAYSWVAFEKEQTKE